MEPVKLNKRARSLFPAHLNEVDFCNLHPQVCHLAAFAARNTGLTFENYSKGFGDHAGRKAYNAASRAVTKDLVAVRDAMHTAYYAKVTDNDIVEASKKVLDGRVMLTKNGVAFTPVVDFSTEYRKAALAVLEAATQRALKRRKGGMK